MEKTKKIQYAVIMDWPCVNGEENYSVALSSWIFQQDNKYFCYWPPRSNEVKKFIKLLRRPAEDWHKFEIKVVAVYETYAEAVNKERRLVDYCLTSEENDEGRNQHRSHYSTKQLHVSPPPTLNKDPQTLIQLNNVSYDTYKDYRAMIDEPIPIIPEPSYSLEPREQPEALYELDNNLEIDAQNTPSGRSSNDFESELETRKNKEQSDLINQELLKRISGQVAQLLTLVNSMDDRLRRLEHKLNVQPRLLPEEDNIPKLPFKTIQELKTFETDYSDDVHNAMVNRVSLVSGKDMRTCIFNQLSDVLAPEVGHLCSWAGRNNNYSIQNTVITKILLDATRKNFPETKKNDFENVVKDWLKAEPSTSNLQTTASGSHPKGTSMLTTSTSEQDDLPSTSKLNNSFFQFAPTPWKEEQSTVKSVSRSKQHFEILTSIPIKERLEEAQEKKREKETKGNLKLESVQTLTSKTKCSNNVKKDKKKMKRGPILNCDAHETEDEDELEDAYFSILSSTFYGNAKKRQQ
ncbi:hypothetical protein RN001_006601 [Aquatica leii]|uniref:DUF4806 domain-containing protein n=1 Tax=Aquatica leii TaxID=1421715 RepID=A0AAN7Q5H6_9COLE|nr:hypothetical protein RN001_006601 [Aquatica leii]